MYAPYFRSVIIVLTFATSFAPLPVNAQTPVVAPTILSFQTVQGGSKPATQTLNITTQGAWRAISNANWFTLSTGSGTDNGNIIVTVTYDPLMTGTIYGAITIIAAAGKPVNVPVSLTVTAPQFLIPLSADNSWKQACVDKSLNLNGDFQNGIGGYGGGHWSVGPSISTQLLKYDLAKKQAGFNTSVGAGASFRYYKDIVIKDASGQELEKVKISEVKTECRQTSYGARKSYLAAPLFSITPTLYVTKPTNEGDLAVQPALLFGFFEDILNFGVGWNLTGPPGEKGNVFLLMSIGYGFSF